MLEILQIAFCLNGVIMHGMVFSTSAVNIERSPFIINYADEMF